MRVGPWLRAIGSKWTTDSEVVHRNKERVRDALFISIPRNASQTVQAILGLGPNRHQENTTSLVIHENHQRASVLAQKYDLGATQRRLRSTRSGAPVSMDRRTQEPLPAAEGLPELLHVGDAGDGGATAAEGLRAVQLPDVVSLSRGFT